MLFIIFVFKFQDMVLTLFNVWFWLDVPKFPKEAIDPIVVKEGEPMILKCNPPEGVAPRQIHWMSFGEPRNNIC